MMSYPDKTLLNSLAEAVRTRGDQPVLHFRGTRVSYSRLAEASDAFAAGLGSLGVLSGDRVAIALPNCPQLLIAEVGAWKAGTVVCPFQVGRTSQETADGLSATGAQTVIVPNRFYGRIKAVQSRTMVRRVITVNVKDDLPLALRVAFTLLREKQEGDRISVAPGDVRMKDLLAAHPYAWPPAIRVTPESPAVILTNGATSGRTQAVVHTHRCLFTTGMELRATVQSLVAEGDVMMVALPLFHAHDNAGLQSLAFVNGNPMALVPKPLDLTDLLKDIDRVRPRFLCAMPTLLAGMMNHPRSLAGNADFHSIKLTFSGAAPLLAATRDRWEKLTGGFFLEDFSPVRAPMAVAPYPGDEHAADEHAVAAR